MATNYGVASLSLAIIDALPYATLVVGVDDIILACNRAARDLLEVSAESTVGQRFHGLQLGEAMSHLGPRVQAAKAGHVDRGVLDTSLARASGPTPVRITVSPVLDRHQRTTAVLLVFEDRKARELSLVADSPAAATVEHQKAFLAMLAHELRNPLAPITSALHIIRRRVRTDSTASRAVQIAIRQVSHQARLLDDLLDASRIVLGKIELRAVPTDFVAVVRSALDATRILVETRAHTLSAQLSDEPIMVHADATRMEQVVRNLLNNAVKYTNPGGSITVTLVRDGDTAVLRVIDSGIGIAPDVLPSVFELFRQADSSLARTEGGLGIGLTLVRRLVELHGGTVTARSDGPGRGTEFEVRMPVTARAPATSRGPSPARVASGHRRILVVEDNTDARELLKVLLEFDGHSVDTASAGASGIARAATSAPDVIFVDIGLPKVDGYEVARRIRRRLGESVRLIALTGYSDADTKRQAREAGFDAHLVKPVSPEDLSAAVNA